MLKIVVFSVAAIVVTISSTLIFKNEVQSQKLNLIRGQVVFLGDSITDWFDSEGRKTWNKYYAPIGAVNTGVAGDRTQTIINRIEKGMIDNLHAYLAVLKIGTNDLAARIPVETIVQNTQKIIGLIQTKNPGVRVLLLGILPRRGTEICQRIRKVNSLISEFADNSSVWFLDMESRFSKELGTVISDLYWSDKLHLSPKGYKVWAEAMNPLFNNILNMPFEGKAVFLGDSFTAGWVPRESSLNDLRQRVARQYEGIHSKIEAINNHTADQMINHIMNGKILDNMNSKVAVLQIGTNDLTRGDTELQIATNIGKILGLILERLRHARIILLGVLPRGGVENDRRVETLNNIIKDFDTGYEVSFLDMRSHFQISLGNPIPELYAPDLLHLSDEGYLKWHEVMWPYFEERLRF